MNFKSMLLLILLSTNCMGQSAISIKLLQLDKLINQQDDTTYIINFWATWCKPCIHELPYFRNVEANHKEEKIRFIYISLNFKRELDSVLNKFLKMNSFNSVVYLIDEPDYNQWIEKVDIHWQGNIPATLIYNSSKNKRSFFNRELDEKELSSEILKFQ